MMWFKWSIIFHPPHGTSDQCFRSFSGNLFHVKGNCFRFNVLMIFHSYHKLMIMKENFRFPLLQFYAKPPFHEDFSPITKGFLADIFEWLNLYCLFISLPQRSLEHNTGLTGIKVTVLNMLIRIFNICKFRTTCYHDWHIDSWFLQFYIVFFFTTRAVARRKSLMRRKSLCIYL